MILSVLGVPALADPVRLAIAPPLEATGVLDYVLPRFTLKTRIKVARDPAAEVVIAAQGDTPLLVYGDDIYYVSLSRPQGHSRAEAGKFHDWLLSDIGQRTLMRYAPEGTPLFTAPPDEAPEPVAATSEDTSAGAALALRHCGRCHVVGPANRFAGIGSTPSFMALRTLPGWRDRFDAFWTLNPHPSFTRIDGITAPFDPLRPVHIAPVHLTLDETAAITAYAASLAPADLGAPVQAR